MMHIAAKRKEYAAKRKGTHCETDGKAAVVS